MNVWLLHIQLIENIIADTKECFKEVDSSMGLQIIQNQDVGSIGFLQRMHPDVEVDNLQAYLSVALKKSHPLINLKIILKTKTPWDGKKRDVTKSVHFKQRIHDVRLDCEGKHTSITAKVIKIMLASPMFQQRYKYDARLIPNYDRNSGPCIQDKIRRCITQNAQTVACVKA